MYGKTFDFMAVNPKVKKTLGKNFQILYTMIEKKFSSSLMLRKKSFLRKSNPKLKNLD